MSKTEIISLIVLIAAVALMAMCYVASKIPTSKGQVYRKVKRQSGDRIELVCGHAILVTRHQPDRYPCLECAEEEDTKNENPSLR